MRSRSEDDVLLMVMVVCVHSGTIRTTAAAPHKHLSPHAGAGAGCHGLQYRMPRTSSEGRGSLPAACLSTAHKSPLVTNQSSLRAVSRTVC